MKQKEATMQPAYVLVNRNGQIIRSLRLESSAVSVIKRKDTGRIHIVADTKELDQTQAPYELLGQTTRAQLKKAPLEIPGAGRLKFTEDAASFTPTHELKDEDDTQPFFLRWAAMVHAAVLLFVFSADFTYEYLTKEETEVVQVVHQIKIPKPPTPVVAPSKTKVKKVAKQVQPTKAKKKTKVEPKVVKKSKAPRRAKAVAQNRDHRARSTNVRKMGALGVLGGHNAKANGSGSSLNLGKATGSGSGRGSVGARGGHNKALMGSGIVAGNMGSGEQAQGGGGYGTKGKAGGSAGYGKHSLIGSSAGYFQPLSSEALVEGGLDEGQISAVIMRNRGLIAACYERGLQTSPELKGRVSVNFVIAASGRVSAASVKNSSLRSAQVEGCIVRNLRGFKFPKPEGGVNVKVTYPFVLNRVS